MTNYEVNHVHIMQVVRERKPEVPWHQLPSSKLDAKFFPGSYASPPKGENNI